MKEKESLFQKDDIRNIGHETPFFLFSKEKIVSNLNKFNSLFPDAEVFYAMKANFEPEILKVLHEANANFEVATKFELKLLKDLKVPAEKIIYGTAIKPASHIKDFYDYGVRIFAADYGPELEKIAENAPGSKVYFRLRVNNDDSKIDLSEKFGATKDEVINLVKKAKELNLHPYGVSFHVGSDTSKCSSWADNMERVKYIIDSVEKDGIDLEIINIGGGYPCGTYDDDLSNNTSLKEISDSAYDKKNELGLKQDFILEPGRGLIADTGIAVASVIGKAIRGDKKWLFLDIGVYNGLFQSTVGQEGKKFIVESLKESKEKELVSLAGPTGDGPDVIRRDVSLPKDLDIGDKVIFYDIGAYNLPTICNFHALPKPCVYLI